MNKYEQLKARTNKKFHTYYALNLNENPNYITLTCNWGYKNELIRVYENNDFLLTNINFLKAQGNERNATLSCMPYPVIMDEKRNGTFINDELWTGRPLLFNSSGDCINHEEPPTDNKELRKQFNKYMLNWQKEMIVIARMKPPAIPNLITPTDYKVFLEAPTQNALNIIISKSWAYNNNTLDSNIRDIKNFRKNHQDDLYPEFLEGQHSQIHKFGKE